VLITLSLEKINIMNYTKLKAEIETMKEWIENISDNDSVDVHCMNDQLSAMEETLETMLPE